MFPKMHNLIDAMMIWTAFSLASESQAPDDHLWPSKSGFDGQLKSGTGLQSGVRCFFRVGLVGIGLPSGTKPLDWLAADSCSKRDLRYLMQGTISLAPLLARIRAPFAVDSLISPSSIGLFSSFRRHVCMLFVSRRTRTCSQLDDEAVDILRSVACLASLADFTLPVRVAFLLWSVGTVDPSGNTTYSASPYPSACFPCALSPSPLSLSPPPLVPVFCSLHPAYLFLSLVLLPSPFSHFN
ncbi:hypothetical protein ES702_00236 [subsurface metagenome]